MVQDGKKEKKSVCSLAMPSLSAYLEWSEISEATVMEYFLGKKELEAP